MAGKGWLLGGAAAVIGLLWAAGRQGGSAAGPGSESRSDLDLEALARMLASETSKRDAWPYMAVAVRNAARARGKSIAQLLREVQGRDVGWGKNSEGHWAGTSHPPTVASLAFAERWMAGGIPDPPGSEGIRSFFEVDEHGRKHDPGPFLARNRELSLAQEIDGWQFYRRA